MPPCGVRLGDVRVAQGGGPGAREGAGGHHHLLDRDPRDGAEAERPAARLPLVVWAMVVTVVASPTLLGDVFSSAALENWGTVFLSLTLQAVPFLVLGVIVSAANSAFVPAERLAALVPRRPGVAVPAAGLAGAVLPGCERRARGWPRTRTPAPVVSSLRRVDRPREPYEYPT